MKLAHWHFVIVSSFWKTDLHSLEDVIISFDTNFAPLRSWLNFPKFVACLVKTINIADIDGVFWNQAEWDDNQFKGNI